MKALRTGYTTGICAAAAAKAAAVLLLSGSENIGGQIEVADIKGNCIRFEIADITRKRDSVLCAVMKDAGDDPDITDGMKICAEVSKTDTPGIEIDGGEGVGRVTKPGLKVPVGKAAINPAPMIMIESAIQDACKLNDYCGGVKAIISVPGGSEAAKKTLNERLGIVGGLSILGTTGIVEPMSDRAIIETIKTEIDVWAASGSSSIVMTPGNYGRDFAASELGLDMDGAIKCANFVGEAIDHAADSGVPHILLIGHAGKMIKLAGGVMNTHSSIADCRMEIIAAHAAMAGARAETVRKIMDSVTTEAAIVILNQEGLMEPVWSSIGQRIGFHLRERMRGRTNIEYIVFTQEHGILTRGETDGNEK